jgi:hypothetical protein
MQQSCSTAHLVTTLHIPNDKDNSNIKIGKFSLIPQCEWNIIQ